VQRRAFVSLGRIVSDESRALVAQLRTEFGVGGVNAVSLAFASGQLKDPKAVSWLGEALDRASGEMSVAATRALGEIRTPEARAVLAGYLNRASRTASGQPGVGEALLSLGRFTDKGADLAPSSDSSRRPILKSAGASLGRSSDREIRGAAVSTGSARGPSPEVRFWAVRGLAPAVVDQAGGDRAKTSALIRPLVHDSDRRVQTEALRALLQFDDDGAFAELLAALKSPDTWLSTSAAENAMRFQSRAAELTPALVAAATRGKPLWLRQVALTPLVTLAPEAAVNVAATLAREDVAVARTSAVQALGRLGDAGRAKYEALTTDPAVKDAVTGAADTATDADAGRCGCGRGCRRRNSCGRRSRRRPWRRWRWKRWCDAAAADRPP
jgi:HEAT repeat protein